MAVEKTVGIDSIKLSIPIDKNLYLNDFKHGARRMHKSEARDGTISNLQDDILISWPKNVRHFYLPEVHFVNYPHHISGRCYEYQVWIPSLPKLMYGNNITEIPEDKFDDVIERLYQELVLLELPVEITRQDLRDAKVRRVDYGKNVIIRDGSNMTMLNELLQRMPLSRRSNCGTTRFYNGEMFRDSIKSRAFIIYDKLADYVAKEKKSRPSYPDNGSQLNLANVAPNTSLIRLEVQVQTTKQLKIELERLGYSKNNVSFREVFQTDVARDILVQYWGQVECRIHRADSAESIDGISVMQRFNQITNLCPGGPIKIFGKLGFNLFTDTCGLETVQSMFIQRIPTGKWSVTKSALMVELESGNGWGFLDTITENLKSMQCITTKEVENGDQH